MNDKPPVSPAPAMETSAPAASQSYRYCNLDHSRSDSTALAEEVALAIAYNGISQAVMLVTPAIWKTSSSASASAAASSKIHRTSMTCN